MNHASKEIPSLTGIRGLAAALVVVAHLGILGLVPLESDFLGEIGVLIFFSLSGFLMAYLYFEKSFDRRAATAYIVARFSRIAPAYLFTIGLAYIVYTRLDPSFIYPISNANILRHLMFSGNAAVFWSIPPEVQFYALFVVIWYATRLWTVERSRSALLFVAALCAVLYLFRMQVPGTFVGSKIHIFVGGVIAGYLRTRWVPAPRWRLALSTVQVVVMGIFVLTVTNVIPLPFESKPELFASLPLAIASSSFVLLNSFSTRFSEMLFGNWLIQRCGECSFSLYLMHDPIVYWLKPLQQSLPVGFLVGLIATTVFAVAYASYRCIERPGARVIRTAIGAVLTRYAANTRPA